MRREIVLYASCLIALSSMGALAQSYFDGAEAALEGLPSPSDIITQGNMEDVVEIYETDQPAETEITDSTIDDEILERRVDPNDVGASVQNTLEDSVTSRPDADLEQTDNGILRSDQIIQGNNTIIGDVFSADEGVCTVLAEENIPYFEEVCESSQQISSKQCVEDKVIGVDRRDIFSCDVEAETTTVSCNQEKYIHCVTNNNCSRDSIDIINPNPSWGVGYELGGDPNGQVTRDVRPSFSYAKQDSSALIRIFYGTDPQYLTFAHFNFHAPVYYQREFQFEIKDSLQLSNLMINVLADYSPNNAGFTTNDIHALRISLNGNVIFGDTTPAYSNLFIPGGTVVSNAPLPNSLHTAHTVSSFGSLARARTEELGEFSSLATLGYNTIKVERWSGYYGGVGIRLIWDGKCCWDREVRSRDTTCG